MQNTELWAIGLTLFCSVLAALGQLLFKLGSVAISFSPISWVTNWKVILGMFMYGFGAVLFIVALKHGNLSVLYPIMATSYIWVILLSTCCLGEPFTRVNWLGIALIIVGVSLVIR